MAISNIVDEFNMDITITRSRYAELLIAEHEAEQLKRFIARSAEKGGYMPYAERQMLMCLFNIEPGEDE